MEDQRPILRALRVRVAVLLLTAGVAVALGLCLMTGDTMVVVTYLPAVVWALKEIGHIARRETGRG